MLGLGDVWKAKLNVEEARKKYLEAIELQVIHIHLLAPSY